MLSVSTALAQRGGGGGPRGGDGQRPSMEQRQQRADHFAEKVGLSDPQKAQLADLRKQQGDAMRAVRDDASLSKEDKKAKAKQIEQSFREKQKAILTPEQQVKAEELRKAQREKRGEKPSGG